MKKYAILLLAGALIGFASCGDDSNTTTQEQIDSAANAQAAAIEAELRAKNDSLINAMAMMKADSAARADSMARVAAGRPVNTRTTTRTTTTTRPTTKPPVKSDGTKVTDRPGATDKRVNDQVEKPKSVSDRPGATDVNR
jgi:hypothetical protein